MAIFEDPEAEDDAVWACLEGIGSHIRGPRENDARAAFNWWKNAYGAARVASTRAEIKELAREHLFTDHPFIKSPFNVAQGAMKATIHRLWKRLYDVTRSGATDKNRLKASVILFRDLMAEIAEEIDKGAMAKLIADAFAT